MSIENLQFFPAETRKFVDFGFMQAYLSFKPELEGHRKNFGALTTIDDGILKPGAKGFGVHGHQDVEVVTFMVEGEVNHLDPQVLAHNGTLAAKGVQIITAGTGILHNEENQSETNIMRALQIWFTPRVRSLPPNYNHRHLESHEYTNSLQLVLSPEGRRNSLIVQQDVFMSYGLFTNEQRIPYKKYLNANACYVYIINGRVTIDPQTLCKGDGLGVFGKEEFTLDVSPGTELLIMDVPMMT